MDQNNIPAPPSGFVPVSGGAVPPPPPGFVPAGAGQPQDSTAPTTPTQPSSEIQINPSDSLFTKAGKTVGGLIEGVGESALGAVTGADDWMRQHGPAFMTNSDFGFGPPSNLEHVKQITGANDASHGIPQSVGRAGEDIAEFFLGDAALKGLSVSQRLLQAGKYARMVEESPLLSRVFQAGVRALRGATVGGAQAGLKTGDASDAATAAVAGGVGNAVIPEAADAVKAGAKALPGVLDTVRNVIKPGAIQDAFQGRIRGIVNDAAKEYGVNPSSATSIRDVAQQVSDSLISKAKAAYQAMDDASGGRVQRTTDAIKNVQKKIRELNGIDPDQEGAFIEKLNELQEAHEKIMGEMEEAGVPRNLLNEANSTYRKAKSMLDLNRAIRASSEGLRPELANGAKNPIPETINTGKLFSRVQKLYDSGRLTDALGAERSKLMAQAANDAHAAYQTAQSWARMAKTGAKYVGLGSLPIGGFELVRHLLGE